MKNPELSTIMSIALAFALLATAAGHGPASDNAQAVVEQDSHMVVATHVSQATNDKQEIVEDAVRVLVACRPRKRTEPYIAARPRSVLLIGTGEMIKAPQYGGVITAYCTTPMT